MAAGISSFFPTLPILFVLAMFVLLLPVPGFYRNRNMSVLFYVGWLYVGNGIYFLNMILWRRNIVNWAPVYCDIATFFITMLPMGISCSLLCINKLVWNISKSSTLSVRSTSQRNVIDTVVCLGIPLIYGLFHIFVQAHRFTIIEDVGCVPSTDRALPSLLVYYLPPSVICCCITSIYCIASISNLFNNRYKTNSFLPTNVVSALTLNRFIRLTALCATSFLFCGTFLLSILVKNIQIGFSSFATWSERTFDFSTIDTIRAQELDALKHRRTLVLLQLLPIPVLSVHFFLFFGFGKEAVKHYQSSFNLVRFLLKRIFSSSIIHRLFHRRKCGGQEEDFDRVTRRSIIPGFRIVSIPPPPAVAQVDTTKGRALRNVDTVLVGIERTSPPASRPHTPSPSPRPSMREVGRGSYILVGRASPFLTGTPPFSPLPSRSSTPSPSERKIRDGFLQPPTAHLHSRRTCLQPPISPSRRTSIQSAISPISPVSNSDGLSMSVDVGHFPHPPPHFFDEMVPSPIIELQLASFPDPPPPRGLRVMNGAERVVDAHAEAPTSVQPQRRSSRSKRESNTRIAYPPPTMANTNVGSTSRFMPRRFSNRFFGQANGSRTSFGFGHGFVRASGTGSLLRIDAEMANAIPSGYSHVGFTVPAPGVSQNTEAVQSVVQAQSQKAHVEEGHFTINEQEFDAVELGDVTRVRSTGGPFYGNLDEGGANTASTRSRFSVYSEDPESPVHTRSRYTRLFSWHSQAARRSGKVNRSL